MLKQLISVSFTVGFMLASVCSQATEKPNLVVILTDDQGYSDVGFNGSKDIMTPNIDRIAEGGTRFTNGYVTYAVCGPSRAGLLTGRYQDKFGFGRNPVIDPSDTTSGMPLEQNMISEVLAPLGYTSGIIGKWHMGTHPQFHPNRREFDYFYGFLSGGHRYFPEELTYQSINEAKEPWSWYKTKLLENDQVVEIDEYLTDELSHKAVEFIEKQGKQPFFLYLAYNAPHAPLQASEEYLQRNQHIKDKKRQTYGAMISAVDDGVGRVLDTLNKQGVADNTLVVFLSDNGGARGNASNNGLLKGHKSEYTEGGIRVPFAAMWPGKIPAGVDYDPAVSSLDILATMVGITKAPIDNDKPLDGVNLIPYLSGEKQGLPHETLYWRNYDKQIFTIRQHNTKTIITSGVSAETYNLSNDLSELHNLATKQGKITQAQKQQLEAWNRSLKDPIFRPLKAIDKKVSKVFKQ